MSEYRTTCCGKNPKHISRAYYICPECERDVTFELVLYYKVKEDEEE